MTPPLLQPVISPILVGRDEYLDALESLAASVNAGQGVTLLVSGEAGIGKSRLVAEARTRFTRALAGRTLLGHCFEHDAGLPYAPFVDLLHTMLAEQPDELPRLLAAAPELVILLPEHAGQAAPLPVNAGPDQDKRRIQEALIRTVAMLAGEQPLLLIIEDIHWADGLTLEVLQRLAQRAAGMRLLLIVTWRDDEESEALGHFLAAVDRGRTGRELRLARLDKSAVEQMLRAIFGQPQPIRPEFLETIVSLTDGNPFFIEEVVTALIAGGDIYRENGVWSRKELTDLRIPRSVVDAVQQRARGLSDAARRLLDVAAVAGQRFEVDILQELLALDDPDLFAAIRELIAARLIVDVSDEQAAFRHALTREAVYAALLARERRAHHLALAGAIERRHAASGLYAADLSYHYHAAGAWEQCLVYARLAGERARTLFAPASEITHLNRALDAVAGLGIAAPRDLYRQRALARVTLGQFELAGQDHDIALRLARLAGDREAEWQSLLDIGALWGGLDYDRSGEAFQQALDLAREIGDPSIVARSLVQLGNWQVNVERPVDAERSLNAALEIFEAAGDRQQIAETTDLLAIVADIGGDIVQMQARFDRAIALYRETNDRHGLASALATVACIGSRASVFDAVYVPIEQTLVDASRYAEEALAVSREVGWRSGEAYALMNLAFVYRQCCDLGRALDTARAGAAIADEIQHREWMALASMQLQIFARDLLDDELSLTHAEAALERACSSGSVHFRLLAAGELITTAIAAGRRDRAAEVAASVDPALPFQTVGQRRVWLALAALALAEGAAQRALDITDRLLATGVRAPDESDIPSIAILRGEAFAALGKPDDALRSFRAAEAGADARGRRPLLLDIYGQLAPLLDQLRRADEFRETVAAATGIVETIAASLPDHEDAARYRDQALARLPGRPAQRPADDDPLTRRERDVARLVARGLSNREIAATLFVGERTVETHVGNILGKLGFSSRAQIAAWVVGRDSGRGTRDVGRGTRDVGRGTRDAGMS